MTKNLHFIHIRKSQFENEYTSSLDQNQKYTAAA